MDVRIGIVALLLLAGNWACDARNLAASDLTGVENAGGIVDVCTLCEEYTALALDYLSQDKTQNEVMQALHNACAKMRSLERECITLVDYYAPLFFSQVSSVQPEGFCKKYGLCDNRFSTLVVRKNKCDLCHDTIDEVLAKLKDPDTKMDIIEVLLKACTAVEKYTKKCKSLVFEFGPLILTDATKFIEKADICTTFHACSKQKTNIIEMVTSS